MTTPVPATDRRRCAQLLLCALNGDGPGVTAVIAEVDEQPDAIAGLLTALTRAVLDVLVSSVGVQSTRATLNFVLLDAQMDGGDGDGFRS